MFINCGGCLPRTFTKENSSNSLYLLWSSVIPWSTVSSSSPSSATKGFLQHPHLQCRPTQLIHLLQLTNYSHLSFTPSPPQLLLSFLVLVSYSFTLFSPCPTWHFRRLILFLCLIFYPWLRFLFPCLTPRLLCSSLSLLHMTWLTLDLLRVPKSFYCPCRSSYFILSLLQFSCLSPSSLFHFAMADRTFFILDLTFCVHDFNFSVPFRTSCWSSVFLFTKKKNCICVDWIELAERRVL